MRTSYSGQVALPLLDGLGEREARHRLFHAGDGGDQIVLALDEKPNIQALERARPPQPMSAGQIERQEFEYIRHDTINFLALLNVYSGQMRSCCLDKNDDGGAVTS